MPPVRRSSWLRQADNEEVASSRNGGKRRERKPEVKTEDTTQHVKDEEKEEHSEADESQVTNHEKSEPKQSPEEKPYTSFMNTAAALAAQAAGKAGVRTHVVPMTKFPYDLPYKYLDLRAEPYLYRPARGEQGVLMVEPYKSELLPHWTFKTPDDATRSSTKLHALFHEYLDQDDFVGADMTRKFIQMGFTRARRYANHKGGRKYVVPASQVAGDDKTPKSKREQIPRLEIEDPIKAESARIFMAVLEKVKVDQRYKELQKSFEARYKDVPIPVFHDDASGEAQAKREKVREAKSKAGKVKTEPASVKNDPG